MSYAMAIVAARETRPRPDGAVGWAWRARGGGLLAPDPGATLLEVTNTNDAGAGSLRAGLEASGQRYVFLEPGFRGEIVLESPLAVTNGGFTLDGLGGHLLVRGPDTNVAGLSIECANSVLRNLRMGRGDLTQATSSADTLRLDNATDCVIDHCSLFWGTDGIFDITGDTARVTVSNSIIAHALSLHTHTSGRHSRACLVTAGGGTVDQITFYRDVFAHNEERNPQIAINGRAELINCVIAGWVLRGLRIVGAGATFDPLVDVLSCLFAQTFEGSPYRTPSDTYPIGYDATGDPLIYVDDCWGVNALGTKDRWPIGSGGDSWDLVGDYGDNSAGDEGTYRSATRVAAAPVQPHRLPAVHLWQSLKDDIGARPDDRMAYEQGLIDDVGIMLSRLGTQTYGIIDGVVAGGEGSSVFLGAYPDLPGEPGGYSVTVEAIDDLVAYWRFTDDSAIVDLAGDLDGTYDGAVTEVSGLPANSDGAIRLGGLTRGTVATHASLDVAALTLSFWMEVHEEPETLLAVLAREQSGLNIGDFGVYLIGDELRVQFQDASEQHQILYTIELNVPYHVVVTADGSGFELWVDGRHIETRTTFTGGWTSNGNDLVFGSAQQLADELDVTLDEVAIYSRVLTDAEIITLSQQDGLPVAGSISDLTVDEDGGEIVIDVAAASSYVGRKADLIVTLGGEETFGTAAVDGNDDIEFTADAVTEDEADSFTYTITDANGESAAATIDLTVIDSPPVNPGGGTLVYQFEPLAAWIDGVALASRNASNVHVLQRWKDGASVGDTLPKSLILSGPQVNYCWNRAPITPGDAEGHPSLEVRTPDGSGGGSSVVNVAVQLWNHLSTGGSPYPRHIRVVFEMKTCKATDDTTYKSAGLGTTTGSYPDWVDTFRGSSNTSCKYFIGSYAGDMPAGGGNACWWDDIALAINRAGYRIQGGSAGDLSAYSYNFDRPNKFGGGQGVSNGTSTQDAGIEGYWHRLEIEVRLCDPALAQAANARRYSSNGLNTRPTGGDGYVRYYLTKDIDGELGTPGNRVQVAAAENLIHFPWRDDTAANLDDLHLDANLGGPWVCLIYGGGIGSQAEGWAWIRKIEVYRHDED